MAYEGIKQGSDAWHQCRNGKVTASRIIDVLAKIKSGEAATRRNYRAQLIAERLSTCPTETFTNTAMQWGIEQEDSARQLYSFLSGNDVDEVAFVDHPSIGMAGASPDGLVGECGLVEIKCPNTATHLDYFMGDTAPAQYVPQMQWQMACTGRKWCDFVSYDPRVGIDYQIVIFRVERDDSYIASVEKEVTAFIKEVDEQMAQMEAKRLAREAA